jgi:hypothetical protein
MALFGCLFSTSGCTSAPDAFKTTLSVGSRFKAGAFSVIRDCGQAYVVQEFESGISNKDAKERYQKQLAPGGTLGDKFPEKLRILDFHNFSKTAAPFFKAAEILVDPGGLLRSETIVAAPSQAEASIDHYSTLGLKQGASPEVIKRAWALACRQHHPDKGGDMFKFIAAQDAYVTLIGVAVVPQTAPKALTYEASPEALKQQMVEAREVVRDLEGKLKVAKEHLDQVTNTWHKKSGDVEAVARRTKAQLFVQQFQRGAKYWNVAELRRWFRVHEGNIPLAAPSDPEF